jgi:hypothetical protein
MVALVLSMCASPDSQQTTVQSPPVGVLLVVLQRYIIEFTVLAILSNLGNPHASTPNLFGEISYSIYKKHTNARQHSQVTRTANNKTTQLTHTARASTLVLYIS